MKALKLTLATLALTAAAGAQSLTGSLQALKAINTVRPASVVELHTTPKKHYALLGSMVFMATGQMLDCVSSVGYHEMNGMIGNGRDGRFNASRGFAVKGSMVAGIIAGEYLLHHRTGHSLDAVFAGANATYGGIGLMAAFHNYGVKK